MHCSFCDAVRPAAFNIDARPGLWNHQFKEISMKLLRYGVLGRERPGLLDDNRQIRDLSGIIRDIDGDAISAAGLSRLRDIDVHKLPIVADKPRIGVPLAQVGKFVGIGLNFSDHARESNMPIPVEPIVFMKATTSLSGPFDDVIKPKRSTKLDWEVELGIVIGTRAQSVAESAALDYVAGYCLANDVSERNFQLERGGTWDKGKSFDTFGPVGPYLVTPDEVGDVQNLSMWLEVNGERMQSGNTSTMIFPCAQIVSYVSEVMTLMPGDIIITGTPPGVGMGMKPPRYLNVGDTVALGVDKLGSQRQRIVAYSEVG
jgi:2,4-diketo-3-deoxy-L-fuconate hydrolase